METGNIEHIANIIFNKSKVPAKWGTIDKLEGLMSSMPREYGELTERGTPGLYSRELWMPKGMLCTSKVHKTCHQFVVKEGAALVYNTFSDIDEILEAGHQDITYPGTRRVLYILEDCRWVTFHPTNRIGYDFLGLQDDEKQLIFNAIMGDILQEYYNPELINFEEGVFF